MTNTTPLADIASHESRFRAYAESRISRATADVEPLRLKLKHTFEVLSHARRIAAGEGFAPRMARICALSALYHDIARFDQYLQYGTFRDAQSRNHGLWAVAILREEKFLEGEEPEIRRRTLAAIAVHNRLAVPAAVQGECRRIANALRDADKLDILRVMDTHLSGPGPYNPTVVLSLPDDPELVSSRTVHCALCHEPAAYGDLLSVNDFRLLLGTWLFAMNFATSKRLFLEAGHAANLVRALPETGAYGEARAEILACLAGHRS